jgi:NhaP-type Na+/H+ or K+/H+ antiporter
VLLDLLREAGGAIALGLATGYLAFFALRAASTRTCWN